MTKPFWNNPDSGKHEWLDWRTLTPPQTEKKESATVLTPEQKTRLEYLLAHPKFDAVRVNADGSYRLLTNLGWLLKNWQSVGRFEFHRATPDKRVGGVMIAHLKNRSDVYMTVWQSETAMIDWLHRPVFRNLPLTIISPDESTQEHIC